MARGSATVEIPTPRVKKQSIPNLGTVHEGGHVGDIFNDGETFLWYYWTFEIMANPTHTPIRWTIHRASAEFGINRRTLEKRLAETNVIAGEDGKYSTRQILTAATGGNMVAERLKKVVAERENIELRNAERRGELLPSTEVLQALTSVFSVMRQEILGSSLTDIEKRSILSHLMDIEIPGYKPEPA